MLAFSFISGKPTAAHIHGPAVAGANAAVLFDLGTVNSVRIGNFWFGDTATKTFNVTPQQVAQLRDGKWYLDVHRQSHPNGEIRGQLNAVRLQASSSTIEQRLLRTFTGFGGMFFLGQNYSNGESFIHSLCSRSDLQDENPDRLLLSIWVRPRESAASFQS